MEYQIIYCEYISIHIKRVR